MNYPKIETNEEIEAGKWYWAKGKFGSHSLFKPGIAETDINNRKWIRLDSTAMWCYPGNSQLLEIYDVYGPILYPANIS